MKVYLDYLLSWLSSPAGLLAEPGTGWHYALRAFGLLILLVTWAYACRARAVSSGWAALAQRYFSARGLPDEAFSGRQSAYLGGVSYWNTLRAHADERGLHLRAAYPAGFYHPPLFVPWSDTEDAGEPAYGDKFYHKVSLGAAKTTLLLDETFYKTLTAQYGPPRPQSAPQSPK